MNISDVKKQVEGASYVKELEVLEDIYRNSGDNVMNGYLGTSVKDISYDELGFVEFESEHVEKDLKTISVGAVLSESVIIKQTQISRDKSYAQLFSWKCDGSKYSYLAFDNAESMNHAYNQIKDNNYKYLGDNITQELQELSIPIENVMDVKVDQMIEPEITASSMLDEVSSLNVDQGIDTSFTL